MDYYSGVVSMKVCTTLGDQVTFLAEIHSETADFLLPAKDCRRTRVALWSTSLMAVYRSVSDSHCNQSPDLHRCTIYLPGIFHLSTAISVITTTTSSLLNHQEREKPVGEMESRFLSAHSTMMLYCLFVIPFFVHPNKRNLN